MDMYCPQYDADEKSTLEFIIYNVSEKSFNDCTLPKGKTILAQNTILQCFRNLLQFVILNPTVSWSFCKSHLGKEYYFFKTFLKD